MILSSAKEQEFFQIHLEFQHPTPTKLEPEILVETQGSINMSGEEEVTGIGGGGGGPRNGNNRRDDVRRGCIHGEAGEDEVEVFGFPIEYTNANF
jgi:hypothetical protein